MKQSKNIQNFLRSGIYFLLFIALLGIQACGGGSGSSSAVEVSIPKDAQFVLALKFGKMAKKASNWDDVNLFSKENLKDAEKNLGNQGIVLDILNSEAIDEKGAAYLFASLDGANAYVALIALLKDEAKFETAIKEGKEKLEVKEKEGWKYAYKKNSIIAWKDKQAFLVFGEKSEEELLKQVQGIKETKKGESLASTTASYKQLDEGDYEAFFWMNQKEITKSELYQSLSFFLPPDVAPVIAVFGEISDFSSMGVSFQKGKVVLDTKVNFNEQLDPKYTSAIKSKVDTKSFSKIPIAKPVIIGGMSLDTKVLYEVLDGQGLLKELDDLPENMTAKDIFNLFSGNVLIAVKSVGDNPSMVIAFEITDEKKFEEIADAAAARNGSKKEKGYYVINDNFLIIKDKMAFLATDEDSRDMVLKGGGSVPDSYTKNFSEGGVAFYINIEESIKQNKKEVENAEVLQKTFEDLTMNISFKERLLGLKTILNMKEKGKNALEIIIEALKESKAIPA